MDGPPPTVWTRLTPWVTGAAGAILLAWQFWLALALFGPDPIAHLLDAQPVLSGEHALHQLHGELGARSWRSSGSELTYDPSFQMGYLKCPWFDAESRPAELLVLLAGKHNAAEGWKLGILVTWTLIPVVVGVAAWLAGMSRGAVFLAMLLGSLFSWSESALVRLCQGDLATVWASLLMLLWVATLTALRRSTRPGLWLLAAGCLAGVVFVLPLYMLLVLPAGLAFLFRVGPKQTLAWLAWFIIIFFLAAALNLRSLRDSLISSWLFSDSPAAEGLPAAAIAWDWLARILRVELMPLVLAMGLLGLSLLGLWHLRRQQPGGVFRGWFVLLVLTNALAVLGPLWPVVDRFSPEKLSFPGQLLAVVPAVAALAALAQTLRTQGYERMWRMGAMLSLLLAVGAWLWLLGQGTWQQSHAPVRFTVGLNPEEELLLAKLRDHTAETARILWEDTADTRGWSPWLAKLTGRSFIGGLTPQVHLDCFWLRLGQGQLAGKMLEQWTPDAWADLCRNANIGWVAVRTTPMLQTLERLGGIRSRLSLPLGVTLVELDRPHSYFLRGQGRFELAEGFVSLSDVVPEAGEVVVSLHAFAGLKTTLARVTLESSPQKDDPLPLVRLKVSGPVSRVTIYSP